MREKSCNLCKRKGHLANMCKQKDAAAATCGEGGLPKPVKPLSFVVGTMKGVTREGGDIGVFEEVFVVAAALFENVEWLSELKELMMARIYHSTQLYSNTTHSHSTHAIHIDAALLTELSDFLSTKQRGYIPI